jgi:hypothetical protein
METKVCKQCGEIKELSEFRKDKKRNDGYDCYCKACRILNNHLKIEEYQLKRKIIDEKICSGCKIIKPVSEFGKDKSNPDGYQYYCRDCRSKMSKKYWPKTKEYRLRVREQYLDTNKKWRQLNNEKLNEKSRQNYYNNAIKRIVRGIIYRSEKNNILHDEAKVLEDYISKINTGYCDCCGIKFRDYEEMYNNTNHFDSISVDRLIPEKGYIISNITLICRHCNVIKNNATWEEILNVGNWLKNKLEQ